MQRRRGGGGGGSALAKFGGSASSNSEGGFVSAGDLFRKDLKYDLRCFCAQPWLEI